MAPRRGQRGPVARALSRRRRARHGCRPRSHCGGHRMSPRGSAHWRSIRAALLMYLAVAFGTAIGGVLRAGVSLASLEMLAPGFPWGTLAANGIGPFVIGAYAALT